MTTANYEESPLKVGGEDFSVLEVASAMGVSAQIPTTLPTPEQARLLIEQDPERARM